MALLRTGVRSLSGPPLASDNSVHGSNFVSIYIWNSQQPYEIHRGAQEISEIKKVLGISAIEILVLHNSDGSTVDLLEEKKITIKGEERFSGKVPSGGKSSQLILHGLDPDLFRAQFGICPKLVKEANQQVLIFEDFKISERELISIAFEWPCRNRLLFSRKIPTPKMDQPNWATSYQNILVDGKLWQGISLMTANSSCPITTLSSYLGAII